MTQRKIILKSWKEIAAYLGVGTRTAQRWTLDRGLPVKRPGRAGRMAVLGFSDDIDRWVRASKAERHEPLEDILANDLLVSRPSRPPQLESELLAVIEIGCAIAQKSQLEVLRMISSFALTHCKAESAGFSILEGSGADEIFRWTATVGRMKRFERGTTPASFSPCGVCIERNSPLLFQLPEAHYAYLHPIAPIAELLLIPMHLRNVAIGTIWIINHTGRRKFDTEDARVMRDLGELASATFATRPTARTRATSAKPGRRRA